MAPFLSFTAEEAWAVFSPNQGSIFKQTYWDFHEADKDVERLAKWARIRALREEANRRIEDVRTRGDVGASLQANLFITIGTQDEQGQRLLADLRSLGDDLKFVLIVSAVELAEGHSTQIEVNPSKAVKCERCWHYRDDVGVNPAHPTICGRCDSNLHGDGESRAHA